MLDPNLFGHCTKPHDYGVGTYISHIAWLRECSWGSSLFRRCGKWMGATLQGYWERTSEGCSIPKIQRLWSNPRDRWTSRSPWPHPLGWNHRSFVYLYWCLFIYQWDQLILLLNRSDLPYPELWNNAVHIMWLISTLWTASGSTST